METFWQVDEFVSGSDGGGGGEGGKKLAMELVMELGGRDHFKYPLLSIGGHLGFFKERLATANASVATRLLGKTDGIGP